MMVEKKIKLNALQVRTIALMQQLALYDETSVDHVSGGREITAIPEPSGGHVQYGELTVTSTFASGLANENVWKALQRKGLIEAKYPDELTVLPAGLTYETGLTACETNSCSCC